jgi:hypothetical protein
MYPILAPAMGPKNGMPEIVERGREADHRDDIGAVFPNRAKAPWR